MYFAELSDNLIIQNAEPWHAEQMEALQRKTFPTLAEDALLTEGHFAHHIDIFQAGQFVITHEERVIASTSSFLCEFPEHQHSFLGITGNLWLSTHNAQGEWLYGIDMSVDSEFRGRGLARQLYRARHYTCRTLGIKGQVIAGMPNGYGLVASEFSIEDYLDQVKKGERFDPTVSVQQRMGFDAIGIIPNYLEDPKCGGYGILMSLPVEKEI